MVLKKCMVHGAVSKKLKLNSNQCPGKEYFGNFPGQITIKKDIEDRYSKKKVYGKWGKVKKVKVKK